MNKKEKAVKELQTGSLYEKKEILELELREEKADAQRRMSWIAISSMLIFTIILFTPIMSDKRVEALADLLGL